MPASVKARIVACAILLACIFSVGSLAYGYLSTRTTEEALPIVDMAGQPVVVKNYADVTDPDYKQLVAFLASDTTEQADYEGPKYTCGEFAARLHDDAEAQGIRCGVVGVAFNASATAVANGSDDIMPDACEACRGHAFVAFNTTDRGLVFVDDTGVTAEERAKGSRAYDMVVYAQEGKCPGEIAIGQATDFDYSYYELMACRYNVYLRDIDDYNARAKRLDERIQEYNNYRGSGESSEDMTDRKKALDDERRELENSKQELMQREEAGWLILESPQKVDQLEIFW